MNNYTFVVQLGGLGDTVEEAWEYCRNSLNSKDLDWNTPPVVEVENKNNELIAPDGWIKGVDGWFEHPDFTMWDWTQVVAQRSTQLGYPEWVHDQLEKRREKDRDGGYH